MILSIEFLKKPTSLTKDTIKYILLEFLGSRTREHVFHVICRHPNLNSNQLIKKINSL